MSDTFGLKLSNTNVLDRASLIFIYGAPKIGKSLDVARVFNKAFWLCSDPKNLRAFASWYEDRGPGNAATAPRVNQAEIDARGLRPPTNDWDKGGMARIDLPEYAADMKSVTQTMHNLRVFIQDKFAPAASAGLWPTYGLVLDDMSEFILRIVREAQTNPAHVSQKTGNIDNFAVNDEIVDFVLWLSQLANATNQPVVMLWRERMPTFHENAKHRDFGKQKLKGGPDCGPTGILARRLCHIADAILHRVIVAPAEEYELRQKDATKANNSLATVEYLTTPSETWERGIRDTRIEARPGSGLLEVLQAANIRITR